jgi:hypothetical protein
MPAGGHRVIVKSFTTLHSDTPSSGAAAAIRERLEAEWRRPRQMLAAAQAVDLDDDTLRAEADTLRQELERLGPSTCWRSKSMRKLSSGRISSPVSAPI